MPHFPGIGCRADRRRRLDIVFSAYGTIRPCSHLQMRRWCPRQLLRICDVATVFAAAGLPRAGCCGAATAPEPSCAVIVASERLSSRDEASSIGPPIRWAKRSRPQSGLRSCHSANAMAGWSPSPCFRRVEPPRPRSRCPWPSLSSPNLPLVLQVPGRPTGRRRRSARLDPAARPLSGPQFVIPRSRDREPRLDSRPKGPGFRRDDGQADRIVKLFAGSRRPPAKPLPCRFGLPLPDPEAPIGVPGFSDSSKAPCLRRRDPRTAKGRKHTAHPARTACASNQPSVAAQG